MSQQGHPSACISPVALKGTGESMDEGPSLQTSSTTAPERVGEGEGRRRTFSSPLRWRRPLWEEGGGKSMERVGE